MSWSERLLKSGLSQLAGLFPSWSGSKLIRSEGNFLVSEFIDAQTWSGLLYGDVVVRESVWNRYLGKLANPEKEFQHFSIRCREQNLIILELKFQTWGSFIIESELVSLIHNLEESSLVLRYQSHQHSGGNWKSKIGSWFVRTFGIRFSSRFFQMNWGRSTKIIQNQEMFTVDFRESLWDSSFSKPIFENKSILELLTIESARAQNRKVRIQMGQRGIKLLEHLGFWVANQNEFNE